MNPKLYRPAVTFPLLGAVAAVLGLRFKRRISYKDKVVVIAGGSRGLALEMARLLVDEGAKLALLARNQEELERAEYELRSKGGDVLQLQCDVSKEEEVNSAIKSVAQHFGSVDVLINNAGIIQVGNFHDTTNDDFNQSMGVHFWGPLYTIRAVLPYMRQQGSGRIVNISSIGGKIGVPHLAPYCASKFALSGLSETLRAELYEDNIYLTLVCPGLMRTGSPFNGLFKGNEKAEFAWFSVSASLPLLTIDSKRAAAKVLRACRYGASELVITPQARLAIIANSVVPSVVSGAMRLTNKFLPRASETAAGKQLHTGWESASRLTKSFLTFLSARAAEKNNEMPAGT